MSKKLKDLHILLPEDHYLFSIPKGNRSVVVRELLELGISVKSEIEELKAALNRIEALLVQGGHDLNPQKIRLSELNEKKKEQEVAEKFKKAFDFFEDFK